MKASPVIMNTFNYQYLDIDIDLVFPDNLTFITGESATGKTFLYNVLYNAQVEYKNIKVFNYTSTGDEILASVKEKSGMLFIVDNADMVLTDELRTHIAFDFNNQYIIIGRNPSGLMLMTHQVCNIHFVDNILSLKSLNK